MTHVTARSYPDSGPKHRMIMTSPSRICNSNTCRHRSNTLVSRGYEHRRRIFPILCSTGRDGGSSGLDTVYDYVCMIAVLALNTATGAPPDPASVLEQDAVFP